MEKDRENYNYCLSNKNGTMLLTGSSFLHTMIIAEIIAVISYPVLHPVVLLLQSRLCC